MRKFTLLLSLVVFVTVGFAQKAAVNTNKKFVMDFPSVLKGESDITDTLVPASFETGTPTYYTVTDGGFVFGPNKYGDLAKAQLYSFENKTNIEGMIAWFAVNTLTSGTLSFKVWSMDESGVIELIKKDVSLADIVVPEDGLLFSVIFDKPVYVQGSVLVGIEWKNLKNGFSLVSTSDGDAGGTDLAYEMWSDGGWNSILDAWPLDVDLGIFPLINTNIYTGAEILSFSFPVDFTDAVINSTNATVTSTVFNGTGLTDLTPSIVVSPGAQVTLTTTDFTNPVEVLVGAQDGTTKTWTVTVMEDITNLIKNGAFVTDGPIAAPWSTWSGNGGTASVIDGVCTMVPAAAAEQWQLQVNQNGWVATNDSSYEFTFTAWADADRVFGIDFEDPENSYNRFGDSYDWDAVNGTSEWQVAVTTTPTVYKRYVTFKRIKENTNFLLNIMTSASTEKVYIDNISLVKIPQIPVEEFNVTFKVDMTNATLAEGDVVYVTGSFNGWDKPGEGESILMEKFGDTWNARALIPANTGEVKYKYFIGASWDNGDTYGFNNGDRLMQVGSESFTVNDIWNEPTVKVTFNVDMTLANLAEGDTVYVTGTFAGGWNAPGTGKSVLMTKGTNNMYSASVAVTKNVDITYKYFKNTGWLNGDKIGDKTLVVLDADLTTNDVWDVTSVNENTLSLVTIYPNPFNGTLVINNAEKAAQIVVSNVLGQQVMTVNKINNRQEISTESLSKGVYFITIIDQYNNMRTERVVKQ